MEGLLMLVAMLLGELVIIPLFALFAALLELLVLLAGVTFEFWGYRRRRRVGRTEPEPTVAEQAAESVPSRPLAVRGATPAWMKRLRVVGLVVVGVGAVGILLVQTVLFAPVVRWATSMQNGVEIEFADASGNLFAGHVVLEGVSMRRDDPARGSFDVTIGRLEFDVAVLGALSSPLPLQHLAVTGVTGSYERDLDVRPPKRPYVAERMDLEDVEIDVRLHRKDKDYEFPLAIDTWRSEPFRSDHALFDALLRSNGGGRFAGRPFTIASQPIASGDGEGRETVWRLEALPLDVLGTWFGGPLRMLTGGTADIMVHDRWSLARDDQIESKWSVVLRDVDAAVPDDLGRASKLLAKPVVMWIDAQDEEIVLEFSFELDQGQFAIDASGSATGLWQAAAMALTRSLAEKAGIDPDKLTGAARTGVKLFKGFVRRRRGK